MNLHHCPRGIFLLFPAAGELRSPSLYSSTLTKTQPHWLASPTNSASLVSPTVFFYAPHLPIHLALLSSFFKLQITLTDLVQQRIVWRLITCSAACLNSPRHTNS